MKVLRTLFLTTLLATFLVFCTRTAGLLRSAENDEAEAPMPIGLFDAMDQGLVEAKLTPKSALECTVLVKNLTKKALEIDMPAAFAGVPTLAQGWGNAGLGGMAGGGALGDPDGGRAARRGGAAGGAAGGIGGRSGSTGGGSQSVGGGMGGGGMRGGGGGMGGGWIVAPEKSIRQKVRTVCLEHGKDDPRAGAQYSIVPIESYTDNKTTQALCEMLGDDTVNQQGVQAAVWHNESGLSYEELAEKINRPTLNTEPKPWFSADELAASKSILATADQTAAERQAQEEKAAADQKRAEEEAILSGETTTDSDKPVDTTVEDLTRELNQ